MCFFITFLSEDCIEEKTIEVEESVSVLFLLYL